ncbi:protein brambleberry-like [Crassostrea angulata]|uniref:protein brambleberry-like n=1 Tax=Magallana angulata TaxID=2784310 RepID=UPI0022B18EAC|nr:protein brambleberry-like [Crassostrea angulata]
MKLLPCVIIIALQLRESGCIIGSIKHWLFGDHHQNVVDKALSESGAKFEVVSTDEKFLKFANELNDMSPLDACYHIVVYSLKKKCGDLTEEDLGKLAVQLLNCQSEAENRPTFQCTADMTIAECTKNMDGPTWNAYQIVGNRARAMCYATQQDQFRRLTEMAVHELVAAADDQLENLKQMMKGQELLHSLTSETVQKLFDSQMELLGNHQQLKLAHDTIMSNVESNMKNLHQEKSLIATGNKQLAEMVENIKKKLDLTAENMATQERKQQENYKNIIEDLGQIHIKAQDALKKLDESSAQLLRNHKEMTKFYLEMYLNVNKINSSVSELMDTVLTMQKDLEKKISWFSHILGSSEDKLAVMMSWGQHLMFFLFIIIMSVYLQIPRLSRLAIIAALTANAVAELKFGQSIGFRHVLGFIVTVVTANVMYHIWRPKSYYRREQYMAIGDADPGARSSPLSADEIQTLQHLLQRVQNSVPEGNDGGGSGNQFNQNQATRARPDSSTMLEEDENIRRFLDDNLDATETFRPETPLPSTSGFGRSFSRSSTPSRSSTTSVRCHGLTRTGTPCRLSAAPGRDFCHRHK